MVRLKAFKHFFEEHGYVIFQFLMVRLKGHCDCFYHIVVIISIPYGSIKRANPKAKASTLLISIPYGSIKSGHRVHDQGQQHISIPYGSIKRQANSTVSFSSMHFNSLWFD